MQRYIVFIFFSIVLNVRCQEFDVNPIKYNYHGVDVLGDTSVAYGQFGSILYSQDGMKSWERGRAFESGDIVNLFVEDGRITAINTRGLINTSYDGGRNWELSKNLGDSVRACIDFPDGYFIRLKHKLITLDNNYEIMGEFEKETPYRVLPYYYYRYEYSLSHFRNSLVADIDSSVFYRFDYSLTPIDTLSFNEKIKDSYPISLYMTGAGSEYLYTRMAGPSNSKSIYRTKDFDSVEKVYDIDGPFRSLKVFNDKLYVLYHSVNQPHFAFRLHEIYGPDSSSKIMDVDSIEITQKGFIRDFIIKDDHLYIAGNFNLLTHLPLYDSILVIESNFGLSFQTAPDLLKDGSFLFLSGYHDRYYSPNIFSTKDCAIFKNNIDPGTDEKFWDLQFKFKYGSPPNLVGNYKKKHEVCNYE